MTRLHCVVGLTAITASLPVPASAQDTYVGVMTPAVGQPTEDEIVWPVGTSVQGTRGTHRVEAAVAHPAGDIVLVLGGQYAYATSLFEKNDTDERHGQHIFLLWSPLENLELWLKQSTVSNRNDAFEPATTQNLGDPAVGVKYSYPLSSSLGVGAAVSFMMPTSAKGTGINPSAFALSMVAAATYVPVSWLSLSANGGYRLDNTKEVFKRDILAVQRFTAGINKDNAIIAGLGVDTFFRIGEKMGLGPFAEFAADIAPNVDESPMRATIGAKWFPFGEHAVEVAAGGDIAVSGTPKTNGSMAGIPPWEIFGQIVAHLNPPEVKNKGPATCTTDAQCAVGQACVDGFCGTVKEVIKEVVTEVEKPVPSYKITGGVFDQTSGDRISNAIVTFSGVEGSALAVDYKTGNFESWALPAGEGLIKVTASAPNYRPSEQTIPRGKAGETKQVVFKIQSLGEAATGEIKGSLKDARSGKPIVDGQIFIPSLGQKIQTDGEGKFTATVKAGRYQVMISGKRHVTQKKEIEIRAGDVVILNVDMSPKR